MVVALLRMALLALFFLPLGRGNLAQAAGPVLYQDCLISWNANNDHDLAGYRIYFGRLPSQLNQVKDLGKRTSIKCSEGQAAANGAWFGAVTAYDTSGNESAPSTVMQFELTGLVDPAPPARLAEPTSVHLGLSGTGFQLNWTDPNTPPVSHRVEVSSSLQPAWSFAAILPAGTAQFSSFQPTSTEWACYRVRSEFGALVSDWAQAGGPTDRQFCYAPTRVPTNDQPIIAPTVMPEPQSVQLRAMQPGFELTWAANPSSATVVHRIEISSAGTTGWTSLAVLPAVTAKFTYPLAIDATWVCLRIRDEAGRAVSLWAIATGPNDRQFCYTPVAISMANSMTGNSSNMNGATTSATTGNSQSMTGAMASNTMSGQPSGSTAMQGPTGASSTLPMSSTASAGAISYDSIAEPTPVWLAPVPGGVDLRWVDPGMVSAAHRIEVSSSIQPIWTLSSIVPPGMTTYTYTPSSKAEWTCLRIRAELQGIATQWAAASGPADRQFCFRPGLL
jgi:hypothetical protein